jgi:hypothetical protein
VGFGREARRARDESLPAAHRLRALTVCIELAQPLGFHATWSYLEARTAISRSDPRFVTPAVELLECERARHRVLHERYAAHRRGQKAAGLRFPPRSGATPGDPVRWHGDERAGALHLLELWRPRASGLEAHPAGQVARTAATHAARGGGTQDPELLQHTLTWARRRIWVEGWESDQELYRVALDVHRLLGQVYLLTRGVPEVGARWHFADPAAQA